ncbi:MAG: hypothetical protein KBE25_07390, partial [Laribacter sp.]|nr:hypothetical protein [Laribacter sp.]
ALTSLFTMKKVILLLGGFYALYLPLVTLGAQEVIDSSTLCQDTPQALHCTKASVYTKLVLG